ncbi:hypothetical protein ADK67_25445 [Saccharothrix sp. NRRL B-16348]|nr:hypothetical protein ADK67_25445 [Saccharothrix sp. NRRL B-16348]
MAVDDEVEVGRFVIGYLRILSTCDAQGRPVAGDATSGDLREVCEGGGEVLVTDRRVVVEVMVGTTCHGPVDANRGHVLVADFPFEAVNSVERRRKKKLLGGVKEQAVRLSALSFPVTVVELEPLAVLDTATGDSAGVDVPLFAEVIVAMACDVHLASAGLESAERDRLTAVRAGRWQPDGLDLVAVMSARPFGGLP